MFNIKTMADLKFAICKVLMNKFHLVPKLVPVKVRKRKLRPSKFVEYAHMDAEYTMILKNSMEYLEE